MADEISVGGILIYHVEKEDVPIREIVSLRHGPIVAIDSTYLSCGGYQLPSFRDLN